MSYLEPIFTRRSRRYFVIAVAALVLAGLGAGYWLLEAYQQRYCYTERRNLQLQQHIVALQQKLNMLSITAIPSTTVVPAIFSLTELLRKSGARLIHWRPGEPLAWLELSLTWDNIPCFFRYLSDYKEINLKSFQMARMTDPLMVTLNLEFSHENR